MYIKVDNENWLVEWSYDGEEWHTADLDIMIHIYEQVAGKDCGNCFFCQTLQADTDGFKAGDLVCKRPALYNGKQFIGTEPFKTDSSHYCNWWM